MYASERIRVRGREVLKAKWRRRPGTDSADYAGRMTDGLERPSHHSNSLAAYPPECYSMTTIKRGRQPMPGYSGTPLVKRLGIQADFQIAVLACPECYRDLVPDLPATVTVQSKLGNDLDLVHLFVTERKELAKLLPRMQKAIVPDGMIWVSWPKKASKTPTDITEDVIREVALPLGLVDTKVCGVSEVWSGLRLVIRKELRAKHRG